MRASATATGTILSLLLGLAGCGPVHATTVISDAETAVARAHSVGGEQLAPYETVAADLYLAKAREEQGHARYGAAEELARKSKELADQAVRKADDQRAAPLPPPSTVISHEPAPEHPDRPRTSGSGEKR